MVVFFLLLILYFIFFRSGEIWTSENVFALLSPASVARWRWLVTYVRPTQSIENAIGVGRVNTE